MIIAKYHSLCRFLCGDIEYPLHVSNEIGVEGGGKGKARQGNGNRVEETEQTQKVESRNGGSLSLSLLRIC